MKVKFRTNLGSRDAEALGLDHTKCGIGCEVECSDETAQVLSGRGWVDPIEVKPKATPKAKAVAVATTPDPAIASKKADTIK